jgi:hydrogenase maturation protease
VTGGVLVVGYGNALRTDDGVGWHVADRLAADPRFDDVEVLQRHQLTPELALDFASANSVVLVDASNAVPAGAFTITRVQPAATADTTWSHHVDSPALIALALDLYGRAPDVFVVSCGAESFEMGDRLSPVVAAALPRIVEAVAALVANRVADRGTPTVER